MILKVFLIVDITVLVVLAFNVSLMMTAKDRYVECYNMVLSLQKFLGEKNEK